MQSGALAWLSGLKKDTSEKTGEIQIKFVV